MIIRDQRVLERSADNGVAARHSSETNEHYTPPRIVEPARASMGGIDLDPASCEGANKIVRATRICTVVDNGFVQPWHGRVFLNPPGGKCDVHGRTVFKLDDPAKPGKKLAGYYYADGSRCTASAQSAAKAWWFKLAAEYAAGRTTSAVFVGFSAEILQTTQVKPLGLLPLDFHRCYPKTRVAYVRADGEVGKSPPHSSVIMFLPDREDPTAFARFSTAFATVGKVKL